MQNLYLRHLYLTDEYNYIISKSIKEYDIRSAGMNMLISANYLSEKQILRLKTLPKTKRNVEIGLMIKKDPSLNKVINEGLIKYRKEFFEKNEIDESNVISIKKDAIFLLNQHIKYTKFDNVEFVEKNRYSSFYILNGLEFYYCQNKVDIKGLNKDYQKIQSEYMLKFLINIFKTAENQDFKKVRDKLYKFSNKYMNKELHPEYYREFNHSPVFRVNGYDYGYKYALDVDSLDIGYNYINYILPLIKIFY